MTELLAWLLSAALVFGLAVPLATFAVKGALVLRWRSNPDPRRQGALPNYLLLVAPGAGAILWSISGALHLAEPGGAIDACARDHAGLAMCVEALLLAFLLAGVAALALRRGLRRSASASRQRATRLPADHPAAARLADLCRAHPRLRRVADRVVAVAGDAHPICTRGLLRPTIEVTADLAERLDDRALTAALLHEAEHYRGRDPLRFLVASLSLSLNPCGFLLRPELVRWRAAREAVCDEWAVRRAADPLSLADALLVVARCERRPLAPDALAAALGGPNAGLLRLRVHLLMGYPTSPPGPATSRPLWLGLAAVVAVLALPHTVGAWPLDIAHAALERTLSALSLL